MWIFEILSLVVAANFQVPTDDSIMPVYFTCLVYVNIWNILPRRGGWLPGAFSYDTWMHMGWLQLVGSLKLQVSFAKEPYKRADILQKTPIIWRSLLTVATPYYIWQPKHLECVNIWNILPLRSQLLGAFSWFNTYGCSKLLDAYVTYNSTHTTLCAYSI